MKKTGIGMLLVLALAFSALLAPAALAQTTNPLANCDVTVQALVWAARDAYGYDWSRVTIAPSAAGSDDSSMDDMDHDMDDMDNSDDADDADNSEGEDSAKLLNVAKLPVAAQQDNDDDDDADDDDTTTMTVVTVVNCDAIRADVVAFIYSANGMTLGGTAAPTFLVDGVSVTADFEVLMSGPQEVPGPGDDDGEGRGWISVDADTNIVCWSLQVTGISLPAAAAHIHVGAEGEAGGIVVPLSAPSLEGVAAGCVEAEAEVVQAILDNPSGYYVNVHTGDFPAGAIRGQLLGV